MLFKRSFAAGNISEERLGGKKKGRALAHPALPKENSSSR